MGKHLLAKWIKGKSFSYREAADALGCGPSMITRMVHGLRKPGRALASVLEARCGIDPAAWDKAAPKKRMRR